MSVLSTEQVNERPADSVVAHHSSGSLELLNAQTTFTNIQARAKLIPGAA